MPLNLISAEDILLATAAKAKASRLSALMTQADLAARAGVSLASLRKFERTGRASFDLVARLALALGAEGTLDSLFDRPAFASLDEALKRPPTRQRGRRRTGGPL